MPHPPPSSEPSADAAPEPADASAEPKNGRPSLYTPDRVTQICAAIRSRGHTDSRAGLLAGVSSTTVARWRQEREDFALQLDQARAHYLDERLGEIQETRKRDGSCDWRAQAWLLQQASPEEFGPPSRRHRLARGAEKPEPPAGDPFAVSAESLAQLQARRSHAVEKSEAGAAPPGPAAPPAGDDAAPDGGHEDGETLPEEGAPPAVAVLPSAEAVANHSPKIVQSVPKPTPAQANDSDPMPPTAPKEPAAHKPSPTAGQRGTAAAAEAAAWQQIHAALEAQWERATERASADSNDPSAGSIPGMWAGC